MKTLTTSTATPLNPNRFGGGTETSWGIFGVEILGIRLFTDGYSGLEGIEEIPEELEGDDLREAGAHSEKQRSGRYRRSLYPQRIRRCA